MLRFLPFLIDLFLVLGLSFLLQSHTNQKNFRLDLIGLGLFVFIIYSAFHWRDFLKEKRQYWSLFLTTLLTCFVFIKIAEYDPIQVLPQKLGIKLVSLVWILFIIVSFRKLSENNFSIVGPFLAIVPTISFINFMAYPSVPIAFALAMGARNLSFRSPPKILTFYIPLIAILLLIGRDWWDDFALQRGILVLEAFLFFHLISVWDRQKLIFFLKSCILFFILNAALILWKIGGDSSFQITSYHEDVFLIPVSLLASNALLIAGLAVVFWFEPKQSHWQKALIVVAIICSLMFLGITISRNSILSFLIFVVLLFFFIQSPKNKYYTLGILTLLLLVGVYFLIKSEKSIFSLGSSTVRVSIWSFYILSTIKAYPLFGFGMFPENKIPFSFTEIPDSSSAFYIRDYIANFESFPLAHNLYVQAFGSFGFLGSLLILLWLGNILLKNKNLIFPMLKASMALSCLLFVWAIHELYDFNSLEISNVFLLVGMVGLIRWPSHKSVGPVSVLGKEFLFLFLFLFLAIVCFRFSFVDHITLKYNKYVTPHNFEFYLPREGYIKNPEEPLPVRSYLEYRFLGSKYFFLNLASDRSFDGQAKLIEDCFHVETFPAICYSKLIQFQTNQNIPFNSKDQLLYFMSLYDPFEIYKRESL
ncbi:O-antigen ligase domain-containing protein [Leptospira congkakensis]|uniref:O-antigen ligase domain-containing protein n=1 Tax=Leptospira congkakensis TaxID=2484932 RepID=A0A4Z1ACD4_9LEPT|nr:O-antigen ligase family protein [Leptospira congkakensis]TGL90251.1 O-antigen ligase domain-containing protein [Leptospira congkakensis]TGL91258.1 O-antigen ligase domain-containing protein [Leptospira congkakensis]TGL98310.1 O-antigen ligase domain-containing protein [Leptospira congkakensis]